VVLSRSSEYALRALSLLALKDEGEPMQAREIANELGLPPDFLTKILRRLTTTEILSSQRGRSGGFRLTRPAEEISLLAVVMPFEAQASGMECLLGSTGCDDEASCPMHEPWFKIRTSLYDLLEQTSLADVAPRVLRGRKPSHTDSNET
jgi:Rrf2 family protein